MKKLYKAEIVYKIQLKKGWRKKKIEVFEIYHSLDRIFVAETPHSAQMQVLKLEKYRGEKFPYDLRWEENYYGLDGKDYKTGIWKMIRPKGRSGFKIDIDL